MAHVEWVARLLGCSAEDWDVGTMWQQQQFQMQGAVSCDSVQGSMSPRPFRIKRRTVQTVSRHLTVGRVEGGWEVEAGQGGASGPGQYLELRQ